MMRLVFMTAFVATASSERLCESNTFIGFDKTASPWLQADGNAGENAVAEVDTSFFAEGGGALHLNGNHGPRLQGGFAVNGSSHPHMVSVYMAKVQSLSLGPRLQLGKCVELQLERSAFRFGFNLISYPGEGPSIEQPNFFYYFTFAMDWEGGQVVLSLNGEQQGTLALSEECVEEGITSVVMTGDGWYDSLGLWCTGTPTFPCPPSHPYHACGRCWVDQLQAFSGGCTGPTTPAGPCFPPRPYMACDQCWENAGEAVGNGC